jgi:hypothetical protein
MKVKVLRSFTAFVGENSVSGSQDQVLEMPAGADWVRAGLVEPLEESDQEAEKAEKKARAEAEKAEKKARAEAEKAEKKAPETAAVKPPEAAVVPEGKPRGGVMSTEMLKPTKS